MRKLTDTEQWAIIRALQVAGEQYMRDATTSAETPRLSQCFIDQADAVRQLALDVECASEITLAP